MGKVWEMTKEKLENLKPEDVDHAMSEYRKSAEAPGLLWCPSGDQRYSNRTRAVLAALGGLGKVIAQKGYSPQDVMRLIAEDRR